MPISRAIARNVTPAVPSAAICALATALISSTVAWRTRSRRGEVAAVPVVMLTAYGIVNAVNNSDPCLPKESPCPAPPTSTSSSEPAAGSGGPPSVSRPAPAPPPRAPTPPGTPPSPGAKAPAAGAAVVSHCAMPPYPDWPAAFPPLTAAVTDGAIAAGAKLVLADNLYLYGPHAGPRTEDLPAAATDRKGRVRAQMAEGLLAAHRQGRLRVTIGRASDY